uniref:Uncharacterized protein n=1 Tax=Anguilla anguilla TaxID=7936 RepID=A0A0E9RK55_ANGAN
MQFSCKAHLQLSAVIDNCELSKHLGPAALLPCRFEINRSLNNIFLSCRL